MGVMKQLHELCTEMNEMSVYDLEGWAVVDGDYPYGYTVYQHDDPEKYTVIEDEEDLLAILLNYAEFVLDHPEMYMEQQRVFAHNVLHNPAQAIMTPLEMNQAFKLAVDSA